MSRITCRWTPHSVSPLFDHLKTGEPLTEEPELEVDWSDHTSVSVRDDTTLSIRWKHPDDLVIYTELVSGGLPFHAQVKRRGGKYEVSRLTQHVNLWLSCGGRTFARVEWQWSVGEAPKTTHEVFAMPLLRRPDRVIVEPEESGRRLRSLFTKCFGPLGEDWFDRRPHDATGVLRALVLKELGADLPVTDDLVEELGKGAFSDHFPRYWIQMSGMLEHLRHSDDWGWAAKHLVPPART